MWKPMYAIWLEPKPNYPHYSEGWAGSSEGVIEICSTWREAEKRRKVWFKNYYSVVKKIVPYLGWHDAGPKTMNNVWLTQKLWGAHCEETKENA